MRIEEMEKLIKEKKYLEAVIEEITKEISLIKACINALKDSSNSAIVRRRYSDDIYLSESHKLLMAKAFEQDLIPKELDLELAEGRLKNFLLQNF